MKGKPVCYLAGLLTGTFLFGAVLPQGPPGKEELSRQWKNALKAFPPLERSIELEFRFSFPSEDLSEKGLYLWRPIDLASDPDGNVYVLDQKQKAILKFDPSGRFLVKAGQQGQGPGEFQNPLSLYATKTSVYVSDTSKREIQVFDLNLRLLRCLKLRRAYIDLSIAESGLIVAVPFRMSPEMLLVDVLDQDGELLYSFGQKMFGNSDQWQLPNFVKIDVNRKGDVFLAFQHFPVVCRYSLTGDLISTMRIDHKGMKRAEERNLEGLKDPRNRIAWQAIYGIRAKENGFVILHHYPIVEILEFDLEGRLTNDYWAARSYDYEVGEFILREYPGHGRLEIFLMATSPENAIEVLGPKPK